ncbi:MAG: RDD family protein [Methanoregula sp.]|uniref:RDD family protein n=1 Tax=Methanoregula sp. TaxID=2052170 RepID=UPI003BB16E13
MFCPKCGKETDASGQFCQWCGAPIDNVAPAPVVVAAPDPDEGPEIGIYAGLGRRFVAFIVDFILIVLFGIIAVAFFNQENGIMYLIYIVVDHAPISSLTETGAPIAAIGPIVAAVGILVVVVPWLYYAGFESSRGQATPGKVLMSLQVTDVEGNRITFARATLRFFGKFISTLIIFIGFLMIGLTKKRQGLHDKIAGCLVLLQD